MNIYERLKLDHDKHREISAQIMNTSGDSEERNLLWNQFKPEVTAHAAAEEQTFYATLFEKPDGQPKARHGVHEHKEADKLIQELSDTDMSSSSWIQKFIKLKEQLEHHMDEEENEIFKRAKKIISQETAQQLVNKFDERKQLELSS